MWEKCLRKAEMALQEHNAALARNGLPPIGPDDEDPVFDSEPDEDDHEAAFVDDDHLRRLRLHEGGTNLTKERLAKRPPVIQRFFTGGLGRLLPALQHLTLYFRIRNEPEGRDTMECIGRMQGLASIQLVSLRLAFDFGHGPTRWASKNKPTSLDMLPETLLHAPSTLKHLHIEVLEMNNLFNHYMPRTSSGGIRLAGLSSFSSASF